jgi:pimeloyl-ACP methyl ester carboxylesterase
MRLVGPRERQPLLHVAERRGEGPPVVLIHGIASSSVTFQNVIPLIENDHECIAIDLLGFGGSPIPENSEYTIGEHVAAIERTIRSLRLTGSFTLVGHSMGALIAARFASQFPRQVRKVVLVSPPIYLSPAELTNALDRRVMDFYLKAYAYIRENKNFTLRHAQIVERFLPIPKAMDINERTWTPFVKSLQNSIESQTTISDLAAVKAPIDVIYGSMDEFHSEGVLKIVSRMTGVTMHRVVGSDHLIGKRLARVVAAAVH